MSNEATLNRQLVKQLVDGGCLRHRLAHAAYKERSTTSR